jgi:CRISPR-associated protein Cas2
MEILVAYDVATDTVEGRRRLRQVAKACEGFGQRVQKSVFECTLTAAQHEQLKHKLELIIDVKDDSLRIYRLREPRDLHLHTIGRQMTFDMRDPLVL